MARTKCIVAISGDICSGKTTIGRAIQARLGELYSHVEYIHTASYIRSLVESRGTEMEREYLQDAGKEIDEDTNYRWLANLIREHKIANNPNCIIVDSVRNQSQLGHIRRDWGDTVVHVHLSCSEDEAKLRWAKRGDPGDREAMVSREKDENSVRYGDLNFDTGKMRERDIVEIIVNSLNIYTPSNPVIDVLVGGQYGSEGKGHIAANIAYDYAALIRSGGPNAGHKIKMNNGDVYCFHHLPSGTYATARTYAPIILGPGAVLNVPMLMKEVEDMQCSNRLLIDRNAYVITESDIGFEKQHLEGAIGSTASGVGMASARKLMRGSTGPVTLAKDEPELSPFIMDTRECLEDYITKGMPVLIEGTQGTGLSLHHGPNPHCTSRDTAVAGLISEVGVSPRDIRRIVMVCRTYPIRVQSPDHGTSGYMRDEIDWGEVAAESGLDEEGLRKAEITSTTLKDRRVAKFDWEQFIRACRLNRPTDIALTFLDYLSSRNKGQVYSNLTKETHDFISLVQAASGCPVSLMSTGFSNSCIIDRRWWARRNIEENGLW